MAQSGGVINHPAFFPKDVESKRGSLSDIHTRMNGEDCGGRGCGLVASNWASNAAGPTSEWTDRSWCRGVRFHIWTLAVMR
jgi:hypothetical protein